MVEFVALAYAVTVTKLPCVLSNNEECSLVAAEYQQLLSAIVGKITTSEL